MVPRRPWVRATAHLAAAILVLTACSGPEAPLGIQVRELPSDVVTGAPDRPTLPPLSSVPPLGLPLTVSGLNALSFPTADIASPPTSSRSRFPSRPPCPAADPRQAPAQAAVNTVTLPPAPGRYDFRTDGSYEITGANARQGSLPAASSRTVSNIVDLSSPSQASYGFEVTATLGGLTTTTSYTLVAESSAPTAGQAGLFLTRIRSQQRDGTTFELNPRPGPGLLMLPFPATPGDTWTAAAADPVTQTTMSYTGTVGQLSRVDACGTMLQALTVRLDGSVTVDGSPASPPAQLGDGQSTSPAGRDEFVAVYEFGTQYGALSLRDTVTLDRTSAASTLHETYTSTISSEPSPPARPGEGS